MLVVTDMYTPQFGALAKEFESDDETKFLFYDSPVKSRGKFWLPAELPSNCEILVDSKVLANFLPEGRYFSILLFWRILRAKTRIVVFGGMSRPSSILAHLLCEILGKKTILWTERSRNVVTGEIRDSKSLALKILSGLYGGTDQIWVTSDDTKPQFRSIFPHKPIRTVFYPSNLQSLLKIPDVLEKKKNIVLIANRLDDIYDPLRSIRLFLKSSMAKNGWKLFLNGKGRLRKQCQNFLDQSNFESFYFLDEFKSWEDLMDVYVVSRVYLLPAKFSHGNHAMLEAISAGCYPIITENVLGVAREVGLNIKGSVCRTDDEILEALDESNVRISTDELAKNRKAMLKYTPPNVAKTMLTNCTDL